MKPPGHLARVRIVEETTVTVALDPYLSLKALSRYSSLSVRSLRGYLTDPAHPLPHYRINRTLLVRRSEFDQWIAWYRHCRRPDLDALVNEVVESVQKKSRTRPISP
jgi:hypothetical protein